APSRECGLERAGRQVVIVVVLYLPNRKLQRGRPNVAGKRTRRPASFMKQARQSRVVQDRRCVVIGASRVEGVLEVEAPIVDGNVRAGGGIPYAAETTGRPAVTRDAHAQTQCLIDDELARQEWRGKGVLRPTRDGCNAGQQETLAQQAQA